MEWSFLFFFNSALLGVGLAMDAFSVSMANGQNVQITENLHMAISKLPEVQKRRLNKYYFEEKTFDKIALEEGCTYQCVQRSVYRAVEKIKNILKNL